MIVALTGRAASAMKARGGSVRASVIVTIVADEAGRVLFIR